MSTNLHSVVKGVGGSTGLASGLAVMELGQPLGQIPMTLSVSEVVNQN